MTDYVDMCNTYKCAELRFVLNPRNVWKTFNEKYIPIVSNNWEEVKFLNESCTKLHPSIKELPSDSGGIYVFFIKTDIIPNTHIYILYIGRAKKTRTQNLRKRCCEYLKETRPPIMYMRENWGTNLYIKYLPLTDNTLIDELESELIRVVIPPYNSVYHETMREPMSAAFRP